MKIIVIFTATVFLCLNYEITSFFDNLADISPCHSYMFLVIIFKKILYDPWMKQGMCLVSSEE